MPRPKDMYIEVCLRMAMKECKNHEEYKDYLNKNKIEFISIAYDNGEIVIPVYIFDRMNQKEKSKLFNSLKGKM